jgi:putative serine protease PepD
MRTNGPAGHVWTVALAAGVVGALVASAVLIAVGTMHSAPVKELEQVKVASPPTTILANSTEAPVWSSVASNLDPSVVAVSTTLGEAQGVIGSGVVFASGVKDTYIVTAADLLAGGTVTASFDGLRPEKAKIVGQDPTTGLALLAMKTSAGEADLANWGDVSSLSLAEDVMTVGARQPDEPNYIPGNISQLDGSVTTDNDTTMVGMLEVSTAAAMPAHLDGGAIVDDSGDVVGIYTSAASGGATNPNEEYAVPSDVVTRVARALMVGQKLVHPWLGIGSATDVTATTSDTQRVSAVGAVIGSVCPGSPAAAAGLEDNDIVTGLGSTRVTTSGQLITMLAGASIGKRVRVAYHAPQGLTQYATMRVADEPTAIAC